jgi:hypothetical protein
MEESKNTSQINGDRMCGGKMCAGAGTGCTCGCGCGWAGGHRLFRVILGIVILLVVFWVGVKVGEFKVLIGEIGRGGYGNRYAYPMMQGGGQGQQFYGPTTNPPSMTAHGSSSSPTGL